jgi:hypothetical protein
MILIPSFKVVLLCMWLVLAILKFGKMKWAWVSWYDLCLNNWTLKEAACRTWHDILLNHVSCKCYTVPKIFKLNQNKLYSVSDYCSDIQKGLVCLKYAPFLVFLLIYNLFVYWHYQELRLWGLYIAWNDEMISNIMTRSRNVYTSLAILTAWYHFAGRECFYGDLMSPATIKRTYDFM